MREPIDDDEVKSAWQMLVAMWLHMWRRSPRFRMGISALIIGMAAMDAFATHYADDATTGLLGLLFIGGVYFWLHQIGPE